MGSRPQTWGPAAALLEDAEVKAWFSREVLPLERQLLQFIRHNWRVEEEVVDLMHDVYELAIPSNDATGGDCRSARWHWRLPSHWHQVSGLYRRVSRSTCRRTSTSSR